jgi:hypothetical protein
MKELENIVQKKYKKAKTLFLYADKINNQDIFSTPSNFINYLKYNYFFPNNFIYVFIDEFQFIKNA